jgi:hypothetical protein
VLPGGTVGGTKAGLFVSDGTYTWPEDGNGWQTASTPVNPPGGGNGGNGGGGRGGSNPTQAERDTATLATTGPLAGNATYSGTTVTLTGAVTANSGLDIPQGVTVKTGSSKLEVPSGQELNVAGGATIEVDGGTLELASGSTGKLDGTIKVGATGKLYDLAQGGGSLWGTGATGSFVLTAGAEAYLGNNSTPIIGNGSDAILNLTSGTLTLKADGYALGGNASATLQKAFLVDDDLTIGGGSTLTVAASGGALNVGSGATIEVDDGGTLNLAAGSAGTLDGTIEVKPGATLIDRTNGGGSLWNNNANGEFVIYSGAIAYLSGDNPDRDLMVSHSGDDNSPKAYLLLTDGTLTLKKDGYVLEGDVTLQKAFHIATGQTLTIENGTFTTTRNNVLAVASGGAINGEVGSEIYIDTQGDITFSVTTESNFYGTDGTKRQTPKSDTYMWGTANNNIGWIGTGTGQ